jgi:NADPH2:quinone reductase
VKAVRFHSTGGPEVLQLDEVPVPEPGPGELRVAVERAGVNFVDTYLRNGLYSPGPLPAVAGREGAGTVDAVGAGVTAFVPGDRIAFFDALGSYAERVVLPAARALPLPAGLDFDSGAALPLQGMTADYLVHTINAVRRGDVVLVHAAAGGVGRLAAALARAAGAIVLGTCSTPEKAEIARRAGCHEVILYTEIDFAAAVLAATGGRGCDLVLDGVGRATFAGSVRATRLRGTLVLYGQSSGMIEPFSPRPVLGSRTLVTATLLDYTRDPTELAERWRRVTRALADGTLPLAVDRVHPLAEAALAHRRLEGRETTGKVLLAVT